jgi:hypothetical protein
MYYISEYVCCLYCTVILKCQVLYVKENEAGLCSKHCALVFGKKCALNVGWVTRFFKF